MADDEDLIYFGMFDSLEEAEACHDRARQIALYDHHNVGAPVKRPPRWSRDEPYWALAIPRYYQQHTRTVAEIGHLVRDFHEGYQAATASFERRVVELLKELKVGDGINPDPAGRNAGFYVERITRKGKVTLSPEPPAPNRKDENTYGW